MSRKGLFFAMTAVLAAFPALTLANAGPVQAGFALQNDDAAIVNVGYYDRGYYDGRYGPYYGNGFFDIPATLISGAFGVVTGVLDGAFYGSKYFDDPYCGRQYECGDYGNRYYYSGYNNNGYYDNG